jgi:hypothetical protein
MRNRLLRLGVTLACTVASAVTAVVAVSGPASAVTCGGSHYGDEDTTGVHFTQTVSMDFCSDGSVRVGVLVRPFEGYNGSHVIGCTAHLVLTDLTIGESTRSDRPKGCNMTWARSGTWFTVGPSSWASQTTSHNFRGEAWVNIQTVCCYYNTYADHSIVSVP